MKGRRRITGTHQQHGPMQLYLLQVTALGKVSKNRSGCTTFCRLPAADFGSAPGVTKSTVPPSEGAALRGALPNSPTVVQLLGSSTATIPATKSQIRFFTHFDKEPFAVVDAA